MQTYLAQQQQNIFSSQDDEIFVFQNNILKNYCRAGDQGIFAQAKRVQPDSCNMFRVMI